MSTPGNSRSARKVMVAVVLGTALSALGANSVGASEINPRAVNDIGRYCTSCWRNARLPMDAWGDCTQEVFRRLLERIPTTRWDRTLRIDADERREFIRAIDAVKKRVQRSRRYADGVEVAADPRPGNDARLAEQREEVSRAADEVLSARQKRIMQLSFEGWSVQEIADEIVMPVERVSDEKYKAIRKLRSHLTRQEG
jgi:RNA polymerase sigma factor (sigma-70 family)